MSQANLLVQCVELTIASEHNPSLIELSNKNLKDLRRIAYDKYAIATHLL